MYSIYKVNPPVRLTTKEYAENGESAFPGKENALVNDDY